MKVRDFTNAVVQIKQQNPAFDFNEFNLTFNGEAPTNIAVDWDSFTLNLTIPAEEDEAVED